MLTVKLQKGHMTKIIEALEVDVYPCGKAPGSDENPRLRTNAVREISVHTYGEGQQVFYVSEGDVDSHAGPSAEMWDVAYIENAHGATTERIRAY